MASGIASNWNVLVLPNLSANVPPVNEPTVAPASSALTIHPAYKAIREWAWLLIKIAVTNTLALQNSVISDTKILSKILKSTVNNPESIKREMENIIYIYQTIHDHTIATHTQGDSQTI